jgi:RND family efflux transporter MFP subunit
MFRKYILPVVALAGVLIAVVVASRANKTLPPAKAVSEAPQPPYQTFVAGAGITEANTENIAIGTQIAGIVSRVYVHVGSHVKAGDPLFTIDDRAQRALIATDTAAVNATQAQLEQARYELKLGNQLIAKRVISEEDLETRSHAADTAQAQHLQAQANLEAAKTDLERLTVRAPMDGQVMQLKVRVGEFAPTGVLAQPLILFGSVEPMNVRVDVDEHDAWRVRPDAPAIGYLQGNNTISTRLHFVRFEPYVVPKVSLTGAPTERVDTRVLQVIYSFERGALPIYVGQQMDVYIDASPERSREISSAGAPSSSP